ncbi:MAG: class I SAM-dependent methyltransferase [Nitrospirota bacterium]|nr:class I SAM-dependent methyltransferase [Nitrospirota bacterium]
MTRRTLGLPGALYQYLLDVSLREPESLRLLREETRHHLDARMQIAPEQGQFMALLVRLLGVRKALEIGVFTGYSAAAVALALPPDGTLVAVDSDAATAEIARRHWRAIGVDRGHDLRIDLRIGDAPGILDGLLAESGPGSFDFAFIDADKVNYPVYFEQCLRLVRTGGLICVDNVLWSGRVADAAKHDATTEALRRFNRQVHTDSRVDLSLVPIADGLTLARKR